MPVQFEPLYVGLGDAEETILPLILIDMGVKWQQSPGSTLYVDKNGRGDLTNVREHLNAALYRALLNWDQPVTVVHPENRLQ